MQKVIRTYPNTYSSPTKELSKIAIQSGEIKKIIGKVFDR